MESTKPAASRRKTFTLSSNNQPSTGNETICGSQFNPCNQTFVAGAAGGASNLTRDHHGFQNQTFSHPTSSALSASFAVPHSVPKKQDYRLENSVLTAHSTRDKQVQQQQQFNEQLPPRTAVKDKETLREHINELNEMKSRGLEGVLESMRQEMNKVLPNLSESIPFEEPSFEGEFSTENAATIPKKSSFTLEQLRLKKQALLDEINRVETSTMLTDREREDYEQTLEVELSNYAAKAKNFPKQQKDIEERIKLLEEKIDGNVANNVEMNWKTQNIDGILEHFFKLDPLNNYRCSDGEFCKEFHKGICFPSEAK